jgi:hypothetical protein
MIMLYLFKNMIDIIETQYLKMKTKLMYNYLKTKPIQNL